MRTWPAFDITFPPSTSPDEALRDSVALALDGCDVTAIDEREDVWRVCFKAPDNRDRAAETVAGALAGTGVQVTCCDMEDGDWARRSQAALSAVRVGRIVVAPPWDPVVHAAPEGAEVIVIEPSMGFGTGHHATTRLCLDALQQIDLRGKRVVDIGTGSGVLALTAARLGAASVLGVDIDPDALATAHDAWKMNGSPRTVAFVEADFRRNRLPAADVVLANLTGGMLAAGAGAILRSCKPGGLVISSGATAAEEPTVTSAFTATATLVGRGEEDEWVSLVFRH